MSSISCYDWSTNTELKKIRYWPVPSYIVLIWPVLIPCISNIGLTDIWFLVISIMEPIHIKEINVIPCMLEKTRKFTDKYKFAFYHVNVIYKAPIKNKCSSKFYYEWDNLPAYYFQNVSPGSSATRGSKLDGLTSMLRGYSRWETMESEVVSMSWILNLP